MNELASRRLKQSHQECRQTAGCVTNAREKSDIGPRIQIVFNREQKDFRFVAARAELSTIGVPFPANPVEQFAIGGANRDQVTPAAMIRSEDQPVVSEVCERDVDIVRSKTGTVAPNGNDVVVTEPSQTLDRIFETRSESRAYLRVHPCVRLTDASRSEDMHLSAARVAGSFSREAKQRTKG